MQIFMRYTSGHRCPFSKLILILSYGNLSRQISRVGKFSKSKMSEKSGVKLANYRIEIVISLEPTGGPVFPMHMQKNRLFPFFPLFQCAARAYSWAASVKILCNIKLASGHHATKFCEFNDRCKSLRTPENLWDRYIRKYEGSERGVGLKLAISLFSNILTLVMDSRCLTLESYSGWNFIRCDVLLERYHRSITIIFNPCRQ